MLIENLPNSDRPRERLLTLGPSVLTDTEILCLLLGPGARGRCSMALAKNLLCRFGSLRRVCLSHPSVLVLEAGMGRAKSARLAAAVELGRRHQASQLYPGTGLESPADTRNFLRARLRDYPHEVFACLFLDNRHRVIAFEELFRGTIDGASVYPREVAKACLQHNAAAVIFAHNHPSGVAEPSRADRQITSRLKKGLALLEIRVLDHFIVAERGTVSFAEKGLI